MVGRAGVAEPSLTTVFEALLAEYGPQQWWPADTPFEVMVGAILTQNTAWTHVERAIARLRDEAALDAHALLEVGADRLAEWIRPAGYFNVKARRLQHFCRWYVDHGGYEALAAWADAPLREALLGVHGVGPETADDILLYAFERPFFVVDAYTRRLFARLGHVPETIAYEPLRAYLEMAPDMPPGRQERVALFKEYHALIVAHAKRCCRTRPDCRACRLRRSCPMARPGVGDML